MLSTYTRSVSRAAPYATVLLACAALLAALGAQPAQAAAHQSAAKASHGGKVHKKKRCKKPKVAVVRRGKTRCVRRATSKAKPLKQKPSPTTGPAAQAPAGPTVEVKTPAQTPQPEAQTQAPPAVPSTASSNEPTQRAERDVLADYFATRGGRLIDYTWKPWYYEPCSGWYSSSTSYWAYCNFAMVDNGGGYVNGYGTLYVYWNGSQSIPYYREFAGNKEWLV